MITTISADFKTITITDDHLVIFKASPETYTSITLKAYINCCETEYAITFVESGSIMDLETNGSFIIDNDFFLLSNEVLPDGIYQFSLEITTALSVYEQRTICIMLDQYLKCQVAAAVAADCNSPVHTIYYILKQSETCNCYCSDMCVIYDRILYEVGQTAGYTCLDKTSTTGCTSC